MIGFRIAIYLLMVALIGSSCYIAVRIRCGLVSFFPKLKLWPIMTVSVVLTLLAIIGFGGFGLPLPESVDYALSTFGSVYMAVFIYLVIFTIGADLLLLICRLFRASFASRRYFRGYVTVISLALCCVTCIYGFVNAQNADQIAYEITIEDKKDISDLNLVFISDLHLGSIASEGRLSSIVEEINALEPDILCIAGDFFDTDFDSIKDPEAAINTLKRINTTYGVYACLGNHDAGPDIDRMLSFLETSQIRVLKDEYVIIDNRLVLVGRLDGSPIGGFSEMQRKPLSEFFSSEDSALPVVVLDHNPANIHEYGDEVDLILCGHTHKGHSFPVNIFTKFMYTVDHGYYRQDNDSPHVVVTSGIGYWGMPIRVGTDSEIVTIKFVSGN